jgi:sporulation protein YlmC with PRC-barrel domain
LALQSSKDKSLVEKKLRGSGGYAVAKVSDDEQKKANLGGPELFLAGIGRLEDNRFKKYYCNKCEKEYQGGPNIEFENPNEDLGENIILIEKGEYKCKTCDYVIAQYRKFNESNNEKDEEKDGNKNSQSAAGNNRMQGDVEEQVKAISKTEVVENNLDKSEENSVKQKEQASADTDAAASAAASNTKATDSKSDYVQIEKIIGMLTYDHNAQLIGRVDEIGLRKTLDGRVEFSFKVKDLNNLISEISWNRISKIGDVIILSSDSVSSNISNNTNSNGSTNINISSDSKPQEKICRNCNHSNEAESVFCEECGKKLE